MTLNSPAKTLRFQKPAAHFDNPAKLPANAFLLWGKMPSTAIITLHHTQDLQTSVMEPQNQRGYLYSLGNLPFLPHPSRSLSLHRKFHTPPSAHSHSVISSISPRKPTYHRPHLLEGSSMSQDGVSLWTSFPN